MSTIPLNDTTPRVQYSATAGQTVFTFPFWATATEDLSVYVGGTLLTPVTDFSAAGLLDAAGGSITLATPATEGQIVTIERNIPFERISEFQEGGTFKASILNLELSKQLAMMQQLKRDIARKIGLAPTTSISNPNLVLPAPVDGKALVFDGVDGTLRASNVSVDALDAAISGTIASTAASATAAATAADAAAASATGAGAAQTAAEAARDEALTSIGYTKITNTDTVPAPLDSKLVAGALMAKSVVNPGGDESLSLGVVAADQSAAEAGTSDTAVMTPLRTAQAIAALSVIQKAYASSEVSTMSATPVVLAHGLGTVPKFVVLKLKCIGAEGGYSVGDIVAINPNQNSSSSALYVTCKLDATNITLLPGYSGSYLAAIMNAGGSAYVNASRTNWNVMVEAFA